MLRVASSEASVMILQDEIRRNSDARYEHRVHAILMVAQKMSCAKVATVLGDSVGAVQNWVKKYNRDGLPALYDAPIPGRPSQLTATAIQRINKALRSSPKSAGIDCAMWDGKALSYWINKELGISLGVRQCQRIFRQLEFNLRKPRPKSAKADPSKQAEYKKTFRTSRSRI